MNADTLIKMGSFLDSHLYIRLIEKYQKTDIFNKDFLLKEKIAHLMRTRLFTQVKSVAKELNLGYLDKAVEELEKSTKEAQEALVSQPDFAEFLKRIDSKQYDKSQDLRQFLESQGYKTSFLLPLVKYSKILYDLGEYEKAYKYLTLLTFVSEEETSITLNVLLGKINTEIMLNRNIDASKSLNHLSKKLDEDENRYSGKNFHHLAQYRAQFLHTTLYVLYLQKETRSEFDLFLVSAIKTSMVTTIQKICPYLNKYIIISMMMQPQQLSQKSNLTVYKFMKILQGHNVNYKDCWQQYLNEVQTEFDFEKCKTSIKEIIQDVNNDLFIKNNGKQIIKLSQKLFFESYCRLYTQITFKFISEFLGSSVEEAEIWAVNLIKDSNIEAKIDSNQGIIYINRNPQNFNEKIVQKVKDLISRTTQLSTQLSK